MPSPRRKRFILLAIILLALTILYLSTGASSTKSSPFYLTTLSSLESSKSGTGLPSKFAPRPGADVGRQELEYLRSRKAETAATEEAEAADATDKLKERLREAEVLAKKNADSKWKHAAADVPAGVGKKPDTPRKGSKDIWALAAQAAIAVGEREAEEKKKQEEAESKWTWGKGKEKEGEKAAEKDKEKGVAGRRKYPAPADQAAAAEDGIAHVGPQVDTAKGLGKPDSDASTSTEDEKEEDLSLTYAKAELTHLISTHPFLIFSKSYCPHSLRAKRILTEHHTITPPPHIVELDQHDLGREIQGLLAEMTGRRTVPNVVVAGESIGGGDEMQRFWEEGRVGEVLRGKVERVVVNDVAPVRV